MSVVAGISQKWSFRDEKKAKYLAIIGHFDRKKRSLFTKFVGTIVDLFNTNTITECARTIEGVKQWQM
jgi:hypothetical protein